MHSFGLIVVNSLSLSHKALISLAVYKSLCWIVLQNPFVCLCVCPPRGQCHDIDSV